MDLRKKLKERGFKSTGKKDELIQRLDKSDKEEVKFLYEDQEKSVFLPPLSRKVAFLKGKAAEAFPARSEPFQLIFNGQPLNEKKTLQSYGIGAGSELYLKKDSGSQRSRR